MSADPARVPAPASETGVLPDYLLIGAQKCGTTFVQGMLKQHPAIAARQVEVHYFDRNYDRGLAWYEKHFPSAETRERILREQGEFATGERSPSYLSNPVVPERVAAALPGVRLLVVLRDPVARALSHYHHNRQLGIEPLSFEDAVACELEQRAGRHVDGELRRRYLGRGLYAGQLRRWLRHFDREQMHVSVSEQLFADPVGVIREIQEFIGVTPVVPDDIGPRNQMSYEPMSETLAGQLDDFFAEGAARLAKILPDVPGRWGRKGPGPEAQAGGPAAAAR